MEKDIVFPSELLNLTFGTKFIHRIVTLRGLFQYVHGIEHSQRDVFSQAQT